MTSKIRLGLRPLKLESNNFDSHKVQSNLLIKLVIIDIKDTTLVFHPNDRLNNYNIYAIKDD